MGQFPGKSFVDIGVEAARTALDDSGVDWDEIQFLSGANTVRTVIRMGISSYGLLMRLDFKGVK